MVHDRTRDTFRKPKHREKVIKQQGRVDLDADWNEQIDILSHYRRTSLKDIIGRCGGPRPNPGFKIESAGSHGYWYRISPGNYYVDGITNKPMAEHFFAPQSTLEEMLASFKKIRNRKETSNADNFIIKNIIC